MNRKLLSVLSVEVRSRMWSACSRYAPKAQITPFAGGALCGAAIARLVARNDATDRCAGTRPEAVAPGMRQYTHFLFCNVGSLEGSALTKHPSIPNPAVTCYVSSTADDSALSGEAESSATYKIEHAERAAYRFTRRPICITRQRTSPKWSLWIRLIVSSPLSGFVRRCWRILRHTPTPSDEPRYDHVTDEDEMVDEWLNWIDED